MDTTDQRRVFSKPVDMQSRQAMIHYLSSHFRYSVQNTWNKATSYACNLKIHNLGLSPLTVMRLYDMLECEQFQDEVSFLLDTFSETHKGMWQAGFNGRSGGYLVLYQGFLDPDNKVRTFGKGTDEDDDFTQWSTDNLQSRVELIQDFDQLADDIVALAVDMDERFEVRQEEYTVTKTRPVLVERER